MDIKNLPELYAPYQKKYTLPSYDALNVEFELLYISSIVSMDYPLRFIRRRLADKFAGAAGYLQTLLQPNPGSLIYLKEHAFFTPIDKQLIATLLHRFMHLERLSFAIELSREEQEDAQYIKNAYTEWLSLKKEYSTIINKLPTSWLEQLEKKEDKTSRNEYMG